jgi:subtilase family serine protease
MQKIDFGDINKFLVSIGLVLIALAILTPYLYLKEDFGLYLDKEEVLKFEEPIKEIIANKQYQVSKIQKIIPWTSLALFLLGIVSSFIGLKRWFKRQSKIDEKFDKEIKKLDLEIETLSPEEKIEKAKKEVQEIELAEQLESTSIPSASTSKSEGYLSYMKIEQSVYQLFQNLKSPNFDIHSEQKLGNRFYIDLLLKAKNKKFSDRIIEIKYFKNQLPISSIQKSIYQLNTYISYYKENTNKQVIPILLIVYRKDNINDERILRYRNRINEFSNDLPNLERLKVEFIEEIGLNDFDVSVLLKK